MNDMLQNLANYIKEQCGLSAYRLNNHFLTHDANEGFVFLTEWIPKRVVSHIHQRNPDGTAIVSINYHTKQILSVVFINDISFAESNALPTNHLDSLIPWIEKHTSLKYNEQFVKAQAEENSFLFKSHIDGFDVFPEGKIEIRFNHRGQLIFYIKSGVFPKLENIQHSDYTLTKEQAESFFPKFLTVLEVPKEENETWNPYYIIEENYIKNDGMNFKKHSNISELSVYFEINYLLTWTNAISGQFIKKDIDFEEEATVEEAEQHKKHEDHQPLTEDCLIRIIQETSRVIQLHFPDEPGKWMIECIYRDHKQIISKVVPFNNNRIYKRTIKVILNEDLHAIHMIENDILHKLLKHFNDAPEILISQKQALEILKEHITIKPVYAYNRDNQQYELFGKVECSQAVNALTGEVVNLYELLP